MKKFISFVCLLCLTVVSAFAGITYETDVEYTSLEDLAGKTFAIVNKAEGKALFGTNNQNLGYSAYADAFLETNSGFVWKAVLDAETNAYYLQLVTPAGADYNCWGMGGVLNSQGAPQGWACSFILGTNNQKGQDIPNGALYNLEYTAQGWTIKNVGTDMYQPYSAGPANSTEATYWTLCSLKQVDDGKTPETFEMPASVKSLIENGTQFYLKSGEQYLIGGDQQGVQMVDWATAAAEAAQSSMWILTENEDGSGMFRAVTAAGDNVTAWGATPCYLNCQPDLGGVLFKMNKDQDVKNGSSWILAEVEGGYTLQSVANKGYATADIKTSADPVVWELYVGAGMTNDQAAEAFMTAYESLSQQFTQVYNTTVNNEDYQAEEYAEVIEEMTSDLNGIQQNMADLQTWYNESYEAGTLANDLDEILSQFEGIQQQLTQFINTFNDAIEEATPKAELAVSLVADEETEYLLNTHSFVTIYQPISAIKVAGLDQEMGEVSYAILGNKETLASGTLSVNTIGYAEFEPITLYEGIRYNVVLSIAESTIYDNIVIGAIEAPEISFVKNGDFSVESDYTANDVTLNPVVKVEAAEWTVSAGDSWAGIATFALGSEAKLNNAAVPIEDANGKTEGGVMGVAASWGGYAAYEQEVTLPAGSYVLSYDAFEANTGATAGIEKNLIGFIAADGTEYLSKKTAYTANAWTSEEIVIALAEETTGKISVGYKSKNITSNSTPKLFVDNVKLVAIDELEAAKTAALAALPAADESIFTPNVEDLDAVKLAIMTAETVEDVKAAAAADLAIPALFGEYTVLNVNAQNYLGAINVGTDSAKVVLAADETKVTFEKAEGGFYIKVGESYINMKGNNNWDMAATPEPTTVWNFNLNNGDYTIQGPKGMIGTDATEAGSACYGDKNASKNGVWTIAEVYAPEIAVSLIAGEEQYLLNNHSIVSVENASAIKVQGLHQIMDALSYSIFTLADGVVAEGTLSVNTIGYAEFEEPVSFIQGSVYTVTIKAGEEELYTVQFNGATVQDGPDAGAIIATYNPAGPVIDIIFKEHSDVAPSWNVDILLNGEKLECEYGQDWNELYGRPAAPLADGEYTIVFPVGSLVLEGVDNDEVYTVTFTVGEPAPKADIAMSNMTLTVAEGEQIDEDGDFKVTFNYTATVNDESLTDGSNYVYAAVYYTVYDAAGEVAAKNSKDFQLDATSCNIYVSGLEAGKEYNMVVDMVEIMKADWGFTSMDFITPDYDAELPTLTFTVAEAPVIANGAYYIQNVESGLFMAGNNSWGTQASAVATGDEFVVALANGAYTITGASLTSGNKTLGYNLYVDTNTSQNGNAWTIAPVEGEEGVYTIYGKGKKDNTEDAFEGYLAQSETAGSVTGFVLEGVAEITDAAKWRFVTKAELAAEIKAGDDVTYLISNPNFTRNHSTAEWIVEEGCSNKNLGGGENANFCAESYHSVFNIHQTIENVPNGIYTLTAQGFYRQDGEDVENLPVFYANDVNALFPEKTGEENSMSDASRSFTAGLYTIDPIEFEVTDGTITLGVKNENESIWAIWDNFQLTYLGEAPAEIAVENEQTPAVDALDGLTFVITDVNGVNTLTACHTSHPAGEQDMFSFDLNEYNGDQYVYGTFAKVADNKYTIRMHNAAAEPYLVWGWTDCGYINFQPTGQNVVFALGLNGRLGQDGENLAVWEVEAVEGGYTMKNVGNGGYYNPAVAAPSAEPVVVKFWQNVKGEENAAIVGINSIATSSKANGKYIENGKVVIVKNGVKYNVAGSIVK